MRQGSRRALLVGQQLQHCSGEQCVIAVTHLVQCFGVASQLAAGSNAWMCSSRPAAPRSCPRHTPHRVQVFGVARQVLSLVAGSAIDEYLLSQLRLLRQEHTLARLIHGLQNMLWPGGTWFQSAPNYPGKPPPRVGTSCLHQPPCMPPCPCQAGAS